MKIKIAQFINVDVPDNSSEDEIFNLIDAAVNRTKNNLDFCIESIDDDTDHPLVDEMVGN